MTCIVGLIDHGRVYLGGDSCASIGWQEKYQLNTTTPKVYRLGQMIIGSAGDFRALQLVAHCIDLPVQTEGQTDHAYMIAVLSTKIRDLLKGSGQTRTEDSKESTDTEFLVGYHGNLYRIGPDFSVIQRPEVFDAIGSGGPFALGALEALKDVDMKPKARIKAALSIAARFASGVDEHVVILKEGAA